MADDRTYIKLHDGMPGHPKVRGLSDKAFRLYVTSLCYCSQYLTDGMITKPVARDFGTVKAWGELLAVGLVDAESDGYRMHDYLKHQRSAAEVAAIKAGKGDSGSFGNHVRWHVKRDRYDPDCGHCGVADGIADGSQVRSDGESDQESQTDRKTSPTTETETDKETTTLSQARKRAQRIPDDYKPNADLTAWTQRQGFTAGQVQSLSEEFRDYWRGIGGQRGAKTDWDATFRNWVRKADPSRTRETTAAGSTLPKTLTPQEIDNLIGPDYRSIPQPPPDVVDQLAWQREQAIARNAERLQRALAKKASMQ